MKSNFITINILFLLHQAATSFSFQPVVSSTTRLNKSLPHNDVIHSSPHQPMKKKKNISFSSSYSSILQSTTSSTSENKQVVDIEAIAKYATAAVTQLSLISAFFFTIDTILSQTTTLSTLPTPITWILCYAFSLKSRTFNPLNNARPNRQKAVSEQKSDGFKDRIQPSWTPPGVVFPIMWLLIIGPLRATSSTLIINSLGSYFTLPLMSLMLHLTCGDIWNTINNTEKRYGTSVVGISFVYVSALHAAWQYYQVDPLAGKLLGATAIWLTIASALIIQTWRLNLNGGELESLLPMKVDGEKSKTQFDWFTSA